MTKRYVVAHVSDLAEGHRLIVDVDGRSIGVFRVGGKLYALRNRCPHAGGELCRGHVVGTLEADRPGRYSHDLSRPMIACPWHGWEFDLSTGQSYVDPRRTRVRSYDVGVAAGEALSHEIDTGGTKLAGTLLCGPYRAETVPVTVEDQYIVLTLGSNRVTK